MPESPSSSARAVGLSFAFEDLGDDLARPSLAAVRFFRTLGVKLPLREWSQLSLEERRAFAREGSRDVVDNDVAQSLLRSIPLRALEFVDKGDDFENAPLPGLLESLGLDSGWAATGWLALRPFDRFALNYLRPNTRLLWRAFSEISGRLMHPAVHGPVGVWSGSVAHAELVLGASGAVRADLLRLLSTEALLDGRALLLARASGVRAARAAPELFDLYSELSSGIVELDWAVRHNQGSVLWQAHVSTHAGEFFPAAALAAVSVACVCLFDMIKEFDPAASLRDASIVEEAWQVGKFEWDDATKQFMSPLS